MPLRTLADALSELVSAVGPGGTEAVPLERASGRVIAGDVSSDVDWPPFDTSAMDGYAVFVNDVQPGAGIPERAGIVAAGGSSPPPLTRGEAVRIMTGAPLPPGTEAIVPVERSRREAGRVAFSATPAAGAHIRRRGESIRAGQPLLPRGRRLRAVDVALAALAGADPIEVFRAPRIAVAVTGDEVVRGRERPSPGRLRDSNGPMLVAECAARGWPVRRCGPTPDTPEAVAALFADAGTEEDFLVTTGGVSAGDLDLLPGAAAAAGFEILFHGVAMRPGKPIAFGRRGPLDDADRDGRRRGPVWWIGLPGNPVSAFVGFRAIAEVALGRFEGEGPESQARVRALLTAPLPATGDRARFFDAECRQSGAALCATPLSSSGSHDLAALARANGFVFVPAGTPALEAGAEVDVLLLDAAFTPQRRA
jgi:molybdopterin molybdotransferase